MIICNLWIEHGCSWDLEEYRVTIVAVVNDELVLGEDQSLDLAIQEHFEEPPEVETLYEIYLDRTSIENASPLPDDTGGFQVTLCRDIPTSGYLIKC